MRSGLTKPANDRFDGRVVEFAALGNQDKLLRKGKDEVRSAKNL